MTAICPHCGQRMLIRHGVRLPPLLADMLDMIERFPKRGITLEVMADTFYSGKATRDAKRCVITNINRLNSFLVSTDLQVRMHARLSAYRVEFKPLERKRVVRRKRKCQRMTSSRWQGQSSTASPTR